MRTRCSEVCALLDFKKWKQLCFVENALAPIWANRFYRQGLASNCKHGLSECDVCKGWTGAGWRSMWISKSATSITWIPSMWRPECACGTCRGHGATSLPSALLCLESLRPVFEHQGLISVCGVTGMDQCSFRLLHLVNFRCLLYDWHRF